MSISKQSIIVNSKNQSMLCYEGNQLISDYLISTAKNGMGEKEGSFCTPRGKHSVHSIIGIDKQANSVFVGREWTGEIYSKHLAEQFPGRDWILTRIIRLEGLETGKNRGGAVDSFNRYIYIHGTPDETVLGKPGSKGCIRMRNQDIINLCRWLQIGATVDIS